MIAQALYNRYGFLVQTAPEIILLRIDRAAHNKILPDHNAVLVAEIVEDIVFVNVTAPDTYDVAVDIRKGSPTYKQWVAVELSAENKKQFFIPRGFAHGFLTLTDDVEFRYKVDNLYSKEHDRGIRYDDPTINVDWGSLLNGIEPILSEKDTTGPILDNSDCNFVYEGE